MQLSLFLLYWICVGCYSGVYASYRGPLSKYVSLYGWCALLASWSPMEVWFPICMVGPSTSLPLCADINARSSAHHSELQARQCIASYEARRYMVSSYDLEEMNGLLLKVSNIDAPLHANTSNNSLQHPLSFRRFECIASDWFGFDDGMSNIVCLTISQCLMLSCII